MSESLSLSKGGGCGGGSGGGGRGSGVIGLFVSAKLSSMKLSSPLVVFVVLSSTNSQLISTSSTDVRLQLPVCSSECSVSSKAVFGRGGCSFMCR